MTPEDGDIVIRPDVVDGNVTFVLRVVPGPAQIRVRSEEEAIRRAMRTARREHVRVWMADTDVVFRPMADFRSDAIDRLRAEFVEMPGLHLTAPQAERLCGIGARACKSILNALVEEKFLIVRSDGRYVRASDGRTSRPPNRRDPARSRRES